MIDYANTPFQKRFGKTGLADGAYREEPPKVWPMIGESRFKLFARKAPFATAIAYGGFYGPSGERIACVDWFGPEVVRKLAGATFRSAHGRARKLPDITGQISWFMLSQEALNVMLALDPDSIFHFEVPFKFESGEPHPGPLHFATVMRLVDLIDLDRTYFTLKGAGEERVTPYSYGPIGVRGDVAATVHLCRDSSIPHVVAASDELIAALTHANIKGWTTKDPADHYRLADYLREQPKH